MSSQSFIYKNSDERYQRDNDYYIGVGVSENDEETLTGNIKSDKIDKMDRVDNNKSDEIFQIQKKRN